MSPSRFSCTNNAESILWWFAKREFPEIGKVTAQAHEPVRDRRVASTLSTR